MNKKLYKVKAIWKILWGKSFVLVAGRGDKFSGVRVSQSIDDPVFDATLEMVHEPLARRALAEILEGEAGEAVKKLKREMKIP
jgi:hypothetical protein